MPAFSRNEVFAEFGHQEREGLSRRDLVVALSVAALILALGAQATTQWLASSLQYQEALGAPAYDARPSFVPLYLPWQAQVWKSRLEQAPNGALLARGVEAGNQRALNAALVGLLLALVARIRRSRNRITELHGSARFATPKDVQHAGLFADKGVIIGAYEDHKKRRLRILRNNGPEHILFFATTGSGKGVGCVLPTCLTHEGSAIVLDIKQENHAFTSGYRANELGQNVFTLNFAAKQGESARYNFLDFIRFGTVHEQSDVQRLATARVDATGALLKAHTDGSHWLSTGIGFLAALILHTVYRRDVPQPGRPCGSGLADVFAELTDPRTTLQDKLRSWLTFPHHPGKPWTDADGEPTATHPVVSAVARIQLGRSENERSGVMSTVVTALQVFSDPLLAYNTSASDFDIADIMDHERPTTIYLVVRQEDKDTHAPIVRLFLDLSIRRLVGEMSFVDGQERGTHKHKLLLVLDEMPTLGKVNILSESIGYLRGWGIRALIVIQSMQQLREHFGQYESFSAMCGISAAYAPAPTDTETAKTLSAMCGTKTVIRRSPSSGPMAGPLSHGTEQEVARPLLTPGEVAGLPGPRREETKILAPGHMLAFSAGCPPIYGRQFLFFQDPELVRRSKLPMAPPVPQSFLERRRRAAKTDGELLPQASTP